ncbi:MAG: D-alanyl-D-alanine carboxypeptidase, partial [Pseudorhodobacter sp.]
QDGIEGALAAAISPVSAPESRPEAKPEPVLEVARAAVAKPPDAPVSDTPNRAIALSAPISPAEIAQNPTLVAAVAPPRPRPKFLESTQTAQKEPLPKAKPVVVTRVSTSGGRHWGVNLGRFPSRSAAERVLMKTMLTESTTLQEGLRKVVQRTSGYDANFMGLSQDQADLACRRLQARAVQCFTIGP